MTVQRGRRPEMARRPDARGVRTGRELRGVRGGDFRPRRNNRGGRRKFGWGWLLIIGAVLLFVLFVLPPLFGGIVRGMVESNPDLIRIPLFADAVADGMEQRLDKPAGTDPTPVTFTIEQGASARQITDQLIARGLVTDRLAFSYLLITEGVGSRLRAGSYSLDRTMTPRDVVTALQGSPVETPSRLALTFRFGLRIEQVTAQLVDERSRLGIDPQRFYDLATNPPTDWRTEFPMLASLPEGNSLEGYLGLGVMELDPGTDAEGLLRALLARRQSEIGGLLDHSLPPPLASFYEALTLASIVEAEAAVDAERPVIAGVFLNRLDRAKWSTRLLEADPIVIYGNDTVQLREILIDEWNRFVFWSPPGRMRDVFLPEDLFGYQSYRSRGLPPTPIRSPTASSIMGVLEPDADSGYLYFVAKADGTNTHAFARTLEEHQANVDRYVHGRSPAP